MCELKIGASFEQIISHLSLFQTHPCLARGLAYIKKICVCVCTCRCSHTHVTVCVCVCVCVQALTCAHVCGWYSHFKCIPLRWGCRFLFSPGELCGPQHQSSFLCAVSRTFCGCRHFRDRGVPRLCCREESTVGREHALGSSPGVQSWLKQEGTVLRLRRW